jgi:hypothetical protein
MSWAGWRFSRIVRRLRKILRGPSIPFRQDRRRLDTGVQDRDPLRRLDIGGAKYVRIVASNGMDSPSNSPSEPKCRTRKSYLARAVRKSDSRFAFYPQTTVQPGGRHAKPLPSSSRRFRGCGALISRNAKRKNATGLA